MSRLSAQERQQQKTEARVGLASNVVGLTAGTAALGAGLRDERLASGGRVARALYRTGQRIPSPIARRIDKMPAPKKAKVAAGLAVGGVALQAANLGGDVVANRVLQRSADVKKDFAMQNEQGISKAYTSPQSRTSGRGVNLSKAFRKPNETRQSMFVPGHGIVNGTMRGYEVDRKTRRKAAALTGVTAGLLSAGPAAAAAHDMLLSPKKAGLLVGGASLLTGATAGALAHRGSKWGREFEIDPRDIKAMNRRAVSKEYRRFDPEADRQRRLGTYAGLAGGTALVLGAAGGRRLSPLARTLVQDLKTMPKKDVKRVRNGALLALGAAGAAGGGAAAYKRGVDVRNRPWT